MPRGDGTGPMGMGPMTGRGAGFCAGYLVPGYNNPTGNFAGYGCGRGFGGRGFANGMAGRSRFYGFNGGNTYAPAPVANAQIANEKELLSRQMEYLESQLAEVKRCLSNIDNNAEE